MLGCLIYELCFLKRPFEGESINMIMIKILNSTPEYFTKNHFFEYSQNLINLIKDCLNKIPEGRPDVSTVYNLANSIIKTSTEKQINLNQNKINDDIKNNNCLLDSIFKFGEEINTTVNNKIKDQSCFPLKQGKNKLKIQVDDEEENCLNYNIFIKNESSEQDNKDIKLVNFNSKTFLANFQKKDDLNWNFSNKNLNINNECNNIKLKNSTPNYNKDNLKKIMKNLKISPINSDPNISKNIKKNIIHDEIYKDIGRKESTNTANSLSTMNSLQFENNHENINSNNCNNNNIASNINIHSQEKSENRIKKDLAKKKFVNNSTKNTIKQRNFYFNNNDGTYSGLITANCIPNQISNPHSCTNTSSYKNPVNKPENKSTAMQTNKYINYKNNINEFSVMKHGHYKRISIDISSMQSREHKATYQIEKIEQHKNVEFPKLEISLTKSSFTPTNHAIEKKKIDSDISPILKDIPRSAKNNVAVEFVNKKPPNANNESILSIIDDHLIIKFLTEKFGTVKVSQLKKCLVINPQSNSFLMDQQKLMNIFGEDLKIVLNYMKYLKPNNYE